MTLTKKISRLKRNLLLHLWRKHNQGQRQGRLQKWQHWIFLPPPAVKPTEAHRNKIQSGDVDEGKELEPCTFVDFHEFDLQRIRKLNESDRSLDYTKERRKQQQKTGEVVFNADSDDVDKDDFEVDEKFIAALCGENTIKGKDRADYRNGSIGHFCRPQPCARCEARRVNFHKSDLERIRKLNESDRSLDYTKRKKETAAKFFAEVVFNADSDDVDKDDFEVEEKFIAALCGENTIKGKDRADYRNGSIGHFCRQPCARCEVSPCQLSQVRS